MSGSLLMIPKVLSMTSRNSFADLNAIPWTTLHERRAAFDEVLVDQFLDRVAHPLGQLEHERAVVRGLRPVPGEVDRLAELDAPLRRQRDRAEGPEQRERGRDREVGRTDGAREQPGLADLRIDLLAPHDCDGDDGRA